MFDKHVELFSFTDLVEINPRFTGADLSIDIEVSFVPMSAVSEHGRLKQLETRKLSDVIKGYTYFTENDVLFAKITPCILDSR